MNWKKLIFCLLLGLVGGNVQAQILDDSTKMVYGPTTTRYFYEDDIKYNHRVFQTIDTSLNNLHQYTPEMKSNGRLQDLGNLGTAVRPLYYQMPNKVGLTSGYDAYQYYFTSPREVRYFDTKSPFTRIKTFVARRGRSVTEAEYSRNINSQWNIGFDIGLLSADKQLAPEASRGDRQVNSTRYHAHVSHRSKNEKYTLLANFSRMHHRVTEIGGIETDSLEPNYFLYEQASLILQDGEYPSNRDLTLNYHLYNEYQFSDLAGIYYEFDRKTQKIAFTDERISEDDVEFYGQTLVNPSETLDSARFDFNKHELGLKGDVGDLFYSFYYKRRNVRYYTDYLGVANNLTENYGGTNIRYDFGPQSSLGVKGEYLSGGYYQGEVSLRHRYLDLSYQRAYHQSSLLAQQYFGNHYDWSNDFAGIHSDQLNAAVHLRLPFGVISPNLTLSNVSNQVYFNAEKRPEQASGDARILAPGVKWHLRFFNNKLNWTADAVYSMTDGESAEVFRVPDLLANSQLYFEAPVFKGAMDVQIGVEGNYRSAYLPYGYDPVTMQYYLQDNFELIGLTEQLTADLFVNARISSANIFLKYENITYHLDEESGYFVAPYYSGQKGAFVFGVDWKFFD